MTDDVDPTLDGDGDGDGDDGDGRRLDVTAKQVLIGIALALVVLTLIVVFIGRLAGFSHLATTLREGDEAWLAVCAGGQIIVFIGYAGAFRLAVRFEDGPSITTWLAVRVVLASFAMSQVVAAGGAAGIAITYWALRRLGRSRRDAGVRVIGLNTVVYLVFVLLGLVAAVLTLRRGVVPLGATLPWIIGVPLVIALGAWFTDAHRVARWATPDGPFARRALAGGVAAAWWARRAATDSDNRPMLGWVALYWAGDVASLWGALHAFGEAPPIAAVVLAYCIGYLAQAVPIPFIATGGMDAATTFALQMIGVPLEVALVAVVAHRVFAFWMPLIPGLVLVMLLPDTSAALAAAGEADRHSAPGSAGAHEGA